MEWIKETALTVWNIETVRYLLISLLRLGLAAFLGGLIGFEREHSHRPAGFRTHILVAVGSALVMLTAVFMTDKFPDNIDVSRMPAQVISGVGFLGAGTILREGFSVKGLTTAASLWAVSCIGLAVGSGFYIGAVVGTFIIYMTLNSLKKVIVKGNAGKVLYVEVKDLAEQVPALSKLIKRTGTVLHSMEILCDGDSKFRKKKGTSTIKALVFPKTDDALKVIISTLQADENVVDVYMD